MTYQELSLKLQEAENALITFKNEGVARSMGIQKTYTVPKMGKDEIKNVSDIVKRMSKISNSLLPPGNICRVCNGTGKINSNRRRYSLQKYLTHNKHYERDI